MWSIRTIPSAARRGNARRGMAPPDRRSPAAALTQRVDDALACGGVEVEGMQSPSGSRMASPWRGGGVGGGAWGGGAAGRGGGVGGGVGHWRVGAGSGGSGWGGGDERAGGGGGRRGGGGPGRGPGTTRARRYHEEIMN